MANPLVQLAKVTATLADVAIITVPANQYWEIQNIFVAQPTTGVAKVVSFGRGTTATAANVFLARSWAAGIQSENIYAPLGLNAADTLNLVASAGVNEAVILVEGFKTYLT